MIKKSLMNDYNFLFLNKTLYKLKYENTVSASFATRRSVFENF